LEAKRALQSEQAGIEPVGSQEEEEIIQSLCKWKKKAAQTESTEKMQGPTGDVNSST